MSRNAMSADVDGSKACSVARRATATLLQIVTMSCTSFIDWANQLMRVTNHRFTGTQKPGFE